MISLCKNCYEYLNDLDSVTRGVYFTIFEYYVLKNDFIYQDINRELRSAISFLEKRNIVYTSEVSKKLIRAKLNGKIFFGKNPCDKIYCFCKNLKC